ncbi:MAG: hypothetical protein ACE5JG_12880, partial [Planctomycetota bacterium]
MRNNLRIGAALVVLGAMLGSASAQGGGQPGWRLDFSHGPLDVVTVHYRDGTARPFYFMTFTLKNSGRTAAPLSLQAKVVVGSDPRKRRTHLALPHPDAEEYVRRLSRSSDLRNIQQLNQRKGDRARPTLPAGGSVRGIAVFGTFDREWDTARVTVSGLEPRVIHSRIRSYPNGFTVPHRGYSARNARVVKGAAGAEPEAKDVVLFHDVLWEMKYRRKGDEIAPHQDPIIL